MKKPVTSILILILILSYFGLRAQKTDWSEPQKIKDKIIYSEVIGASKGNYFIIRYNKKAKQQFIIEKYDNKLRLAKKFEFEVSKDISVEKIMLLDGKIYIFSVSYDGELKKHQLLVNVFSDNFAVLVSDKLLISSDFKISNRKSFHITKDFINNRILIIYPESTKDINNILFRLAIFNSDLERTYFNNFIIDTDINYQIDQFQLVDSTIAIVYKTFKGNADEPTNERYHLVDFDLKHKKQTIYKFADDSIFFRNMLIKYDIPNHTLICAGYYSYLSSDNSEGIAYLKIFTSKDSAIFNSIPFPEELKNIQLGKNNRREKINSFFPKGLVVRDDGGFLFIGEYFKIQKEVYTDYYTFSNSYVRYFYHYGNAMLISVDPDGKIDWQKIVRKEQVSMSDDGFYSSISTATTDQKVALLYNDISRNRTNLIFNAIEPNNTISNFIIVNGNSFNGSLIPKQGKQVDLNEMIVPGFESKKGFLFVRIKF
jgi:hypothetical protein